MIFSTIKNYPGYIVTSNGEIYSLKHKKPRRLITQKNWGGYERVGLCANGKQRYFLVHRIVAETFLKNPDGKPFINHKDENKSNNDVSNLEWCTTAENNQYGTRLARISASNKKKIKQIDCSGNVVRIWDSQTDAANALNLEIKNINACLKNRRKHCGGYEWRFVNE